MRGKEMLPIFANWNNLRSYDPSAGPIDPINYKNIVPKVEIWNQILLIKNDNEFPFH